MATFDPGQITEPTTFRAVCTGPGGIIVSDPFTVTPSSDCDGQPLAMITDTPECLDSETSETCADCVNGTIIGWRYRVDGGAWTDV